NRDPSPRCRPPAAWTRANASNSASSSSGRTQRIWAFSPASTHQAASMPSASIRADGIMTSSAFLTARSEEHTSELQSRFDLVCRLLLEKKKHLDTIEKSILDSRNCLKRFLLS